MAYKIGVMGKAGRSRILPPDLVKKAQEVGRAIAKEGCVLVTGSCMGVSFEAAKAANKAGGVVLAFSPASNRKEHLEPPISYPLPTEDTELIFTGAGKIGRNVLSIKECDAVIIVGGGLGTLNEFSIAAHEGKVIGVLAGTGGVVEKLMKLEIKDEFSDKAGAVLISNPNPKRLVKKVIAKIKEKERCFIGRKEIPITFLNEKGKRLVGIFHLPEAVYKPPLVIAVHGFGQTKTDRKLIDLGRALADSGIAFFRFDFEGCGDSEGELADSTVENQLTDLHCAYKAVLKQADIDSQRVAFVGHSLGAVVVSLFTNKFNVAVKTLVLWSPAFCQKKLFPIWHTREDLKKWKEQGYLIRKDKKMGIALLRENENKDYTGEFEKIKAPILILHGQDDEAVPLDFSEKLSEKYKNIALLKIKKADHKFESYLAQKKLIKETTGWLKKHL